MSSTPWRAPRPYASARAARPARPHSSSAQTHIARALGAQSIRARPESDGEPGEIRRAQRRGLGHARPHHRNARAYRPGTASADRSPPRRRRRAARAAARPSRCPPPPARRPPGRRWLPAPPAQCVPCPVSRRSPISMPAACASQCGAPSPTNAGTNTTPPVSGTLAASASTSADAPMSFRLSRSHCTTAPPIKMLPSSAYSRRFCALAATVVISLCLRPHELRADVLQQKAAGPVSVLGLARAPAQLPEERRLLVAGNARNRHAAQAERRRHFAHALARPHHFRQHARGNSEELQQLRVPLALHNVEEQRA